MLKFIKLSYYSVTYMHIAEAVAIRLYIYLIGLLIE